MKKVEKFELQTVKELHKDINSAIAAVCEKYGVKLHGGTSVSYSADLFKMSLSIIPEASAVKQEDNPAAYVGRFFKNKNTYFKITGLRPSGELSAVTQNGTRYRMEASQVLAMKEIDAALVAHIPAFK